MECPPFGQLIGGAQRKPVEDRRLIASAGSALFFQRPCQGDIMPGVAVDSEVKMGGQSVLRVFAQGERDLDALLSEGTLVDAIAAAHPNVAIEPITSGSGRTDQLIQKMSGGPVPAALAEMGFEDDFLAGEFASDILDPSLDVVLLSAASDLTRTHWVHRSEGWIIAPPGDWEATWPDEVRSRFAAEFEEADLMSADHYSASVREVVTRVREASGAHVLLVGASTLGEDVGTSYFGRDDDHRLRTHRVNAAQIRLSMALGVSVVDVDRIIANLGGAGSVAAPLEYNHAAMAAIADEIVYILADIGFFENRPLVAQAGQELGSA